MDFVLPFLCRLRRNDEQSIAAIACPTFAEVASPMMCSQTESAFRLPPPLPCSLRTRD